MRPKGLQPLPWIPMTLVVRAILQERSGYLHNPILRYFGQVRVLTLEKPSLHTLLKKSAAALPVAQALLSRCGNWA
jgi:hypothetical protein